MIHRCFVPITYGGGLSEIEEVDAAFRNGADKVAFNSSFYDTPQLIKEVVQRYGSQSTVVSLDVIKTPKGNYVYNYLNHENREELLIQALRRAEEIEVGEVLINSVDHDGKYLGFDLALSNDFKKARIPIILQGGAKSYKHFMEAMEMTNASAFAAGNMFHFQEHSVTRLKSALNKDSVRKDEFFNYDQHDFHLDQRLVKPKEHYLNDLIYEKLADREI